MAERYYVPYEVKRPSEAVAALLNATMQHVADFMQCMLEILAEKYNLSEEEMMNVLFEHPKYKEMLVNPMLSALSAATTSPDAATPSAREVQETEEKPKKKMVIIKNKDGTVKKVRKVIKGQGIKID